MNYPQETAIRTSSHAVDPTSRLRAVVDIHYKSILQTLGWFGQVNARVSEREIRGLLLNAEDIAGLGLEDKLFHAFARLQGADASSMDVATAYCSRAIHAFEIVSPDGQVSWHAPGETFPDGFIHQLEFAANPRYHPYAEIMRRR